MITQLIVCMMLCVCVCVCPHNNRPLQLAHSVKLGMAQGEIDWIIFEQSAVGTAAPCTVHAVVEVKRNVDDIAKSYRQVNTCLLNTNVALTAL
jgi:hypothetical protein